MRELDHVQKRAMFIICPGDSYHEALDIVNFKELAIDHDEICESLFARTHLSFPFFSRVDPI